MRVLSCLCLTLLLLAPVARADSQTAPFDASRAWAEFETTLRERYPYLQRPGVDGEAILAAFRSRAQAATSSEVLVDVIQQAAFNFADPHLTAGPFVGREVSLLPTGSDLYAVKGQPGWQIVDVRAGSAASAAGIRPGDIVMSVDGREPDEAIQSLLGQPMRALSGAQQTHGINLALAGMFDEKRVLVLARDGATRTIELAPVAGQAAAIGSLPPLSWQRRGSLVVLRVNNSLGNNATIQAFRDGIGSYLDAGAILIDLRNTPSGGNTTVARAIMGAFTTCTRPYQQHVYTWEERTFGVPRQAIELVAPGPVQFRGRVYVASGRWTGSMGEGLTIGLDVLGATTVGAPMADLLGGIENVTLDLSGARLDLPVERLLHVDGTPREDFVPRLALASAEARADGSDPVIGAVEADLAQARPQGRGLRWPGYRACR